MTYEEFLKLTKKNLKRFFPESFQERKVEIMEVLKNNNIKLQGVYLPGTKSYTSVPLLYLESYYQELEDGKKLEDVWQKNCSGLSEVPGSRDKHRWHFKQGMGL